MDTLQLFATEHVSRDLQKRYQDLVYQATSMTNGGAVYLAFEFQSTVDKHMPLRMNSYCSLLLEQLVRTQPKGLDSAYPRIYPIVIYNGKRRWTAPLQLSEWFGRRSSMLSNYRGRCRINLVDLSTYKEWALQCEGSPLALLIRLEGAESVEELAEVAEEFTEWYQSSGVDTLKTDLTGLLKANAELVGGIELRNRLAGVQDMGRLAETMKEWIAEKEAAGIALGLEHWNRDFGTRIGARTGTGSGTRIGARTGTGSGTGIGARTGTGSGTGLEQGEQGLEQGLIQGKRDMLLRQVESKYGLQVREEFTETLQQCTKPEALDRFADWILECDTVGDLYQRIRSSSNGMNWLD